MNRDEPRTFAASLQRQLYQLVKAYELCDQACLVQNGVTASQGYTLLSLPEEGNLTMNELSAAMELANSTMTRLVDQLVQKELASRKPDDEDRRIVRVELTGQGREMRHTLEQALENCFRQVLTEIQEDECLVILHALQQVTRLVVKALALEGCHTD